MYYRLSRSQNIHEIGFYPQADLKIGYDPTDNGHFKTKQYEFPDFEPKLELILNQKAKTTNYLDSTAGLLNGFIVDEKLKSILLNHKLPSYRFYPIKVYKDDVLLNYYWFYFIIDDFWEHINRQKSYVEVFSKKNVFDVQIDKTFSFLSKEYVLKEKKKYRLGRTRIGKILMNDSFPNYDLYRTDCFPHTIISQKLKEVFEINSITGYSLSSFEKFSVTET